jgi:hypothetical protein
MRDVIEEIPDAADAEAGQRFGALGADAFQILDGCVELELHPLTRRRA